jgi:EAL domain-containing protein (putative c-di-GMP-specific phosphodiesterase class I)
VADRLVDELLALARRQLGAAISFVGRFEDGHRVMRGVSCDAPIAVGRGHTEHLDTTLCQRILDGRLPRVIPDTACEPEAMALPVTTAVPIGSYVGVPVLLSDGRLYGTLCCLSPTPQPGLLDRDAEFLTAVATSLARVLEVEEAELSAARALHARVTAALDPRARRTVFQPVVSLRDGAVIGTEALTRFDLEEGEAPDRWFADAERSGLRAELELCAARSAWQQAAALPGRLFLNFSATTLTSPQFAAFLADTDPRRLVVEVSEHERIADYAGVAAMLRPLRAQGLAVAVDDAGAGFASLRHVVLLAPDVIKIDLSLVRGVDRDPARRALVTALATFAEQTGADVVAEGVETAAEHAALRDAGVGFGQGFLVGPGVPAAEFVTRFGRRPTLPAPRRPRARARQVR